MANKPDLVCFLLKEDPSDRFLVRHIFQRMLGWKLEIVTTPEEASAWGVPVVTYGEASIEGAYEIRPADGSAVITTRYPDDIINAARALLIPPMEGAQLDQHGRTLTRCLPQWNAGLIEEPILDRWVLELGAQLRKHFPTLPAPRRAYKHIATMDVDNGFMYLGRVWWRTAGASVRQLLRGEFGPLSDRVSTLRGRMKDPYDVYDAFRMMTQGCADRVILNFLVAPRGAHDHAVGTGDALMRERMVAVSNWAQVGIHPSYDSASTSALFAREKDRLEQVIGRSVTISRQHFLRMRLPSTYNELERIGIREDHSVGLADTIGFRCGTCTPFPFFDPVAQRETDLMLFPFAVMDSAMAYHMKLSPDEAIQRGRRLVDMVRQVQGTFIGVWHERFLSDYGTEQGWKRVVQDIIQYAKP